MKNRSMGQIPYAVAAIAALVMTSGCDRAVKERSQMATVDVPAMLDAERCRACHALDEMRLGPSYRMIAERHASGENGGENMVEVMAQKILHGGAGNWGIVPMVANEHHVSPEQARQMAGWILTQTEGE